MMTRGLANAVVECATRVQIVDVVANVREEDDPVPVAEERGADGAREVAVLVAQDEDDALRGLESPSSSSSFTNLQTRRVRKLGRRRRLCDEKVAHRLVRQVRVDVVRRKVGDPARSKHVSIGRRVRRESSPVTRRPKRGVGDDSRGSTRPHQSVTADEARRGGRHRVSRPQRVERNACVPPTRLERDGQ